jgi:hypothetical protein
LSLRLARKGARGPAWRQARRVGSRIRREVIVVINTVQKCFRSSAATYRSRTSIWNPGSPYCTAHREATRLTMPRH